MKKTQENTSPIFIIGIGRSGTTLLSKLLNQHPNINVLPEIPFLLFFHKKFKSKKITAQDLELTKNYLYEFSNTEESRLIVDKIIFDLKNKENLNYNEFCNTIYKRLHTKNSQIQYVFDKNPYYTFYVDRILSIYPNAKFIYMVRDFRANIYSRSANKNNRSTSVYFNAIRWDDFNKAGIKAIKKHPKNILLVKYENLINNTVAKLDEIAAFTEIENYVFETSPSELSIKDTPFFPKVASSHFKEQHQDKLSKNITSEHIDKWKKGLTEEQINICEKVCGQTAEYFGYKNTLAKHSKSLYNPIIYLKAKWDIVKDFILYYIPLSIKLKRLIKVNSKIHK